MRKLARTFVVALVVVLMGVVSVVPVAAASRPSGRTVIVCGIFDGGGSTG
ncbi:MAG: hypothetical protein GX601_03715 [Anaerolineales bacterium]|nr:hypothetical protein [Anaerolineales bacterium]